MKRELTFINEVQELNRVAGFIEGVCEALQLDMHMTLKLQLAIEEVATNVIYYAYPKGTKARITLSAESNGKEVIFVLSDTGIPFDPTTREDPDVNVDPMDRAQGGLGIFIVKQIMNEVSYLRLGDTNQLTMKKTL